MKSDSPLPDAYRRHLERPSEGGRKAPSKGLLRETRGAVYVEFLIAFLPVFVFFLCMIQLSLLFAAKLMVEHAAVTGARAAAVVFGDEPSVYGESTAETNVMTKKRLSAVRDAAILSLAPLILDGSLMSLDVVFPDPRDPKTKRPEGTHLAAMSLSGTHMLPVRIEATVRCKIAIADAIACAGVRNAIRDVIGFTRVAEIRAQSVFPYQGASYVYPAR